LRRFGKGCVSGIARLLSRLATEGRHVNSSNGFSVGKFKRLNSCGPFTNVNEGNDESGDVAVARHLSLH
jgi:hypothetical protein